MGFFDLFKKKNTEPTYDVTNLSVKDLNKGFIIDYDLKSWEVTEVYQYDWGNGNISKEYKLDSGDDTVYLHVTRGVELELTITRSIKIRKLDEDIIDKTVEMEHPPKKLTYEGIKYYMHTDSAGYFNDITGGGDEWEELIEWSYYDDDEEHILSISQWGERDFSASVGKIIKEFEISNIIPGN